ncbi:MAG TPA: acetyl-CoA carboxylase biotin carboxyl carrier protein subunit [Candidatus Binatia bacterium]|jgi:biotin carboxyl carrier protein
MRISLRHKQHHVAVDVQSDGGAYRVGLDGAEHVVEAHYLDDATLFVVVDGRQYRVDLVRNGRDRLVAVDGEVYQFVSESGASAHRVATVASPEITAPMPGRVLEALVQPGQHIVAGDGLLILEAMKMENRLVAEATGTVSELRVSAGDMVEAGQVLVVLSYDSEVSQ